MTTDTAAAMEIARETAEGGPVDRFLDRMAERIGGRASVKAVFGEPIERGDVTVVPVAPRSMGLRRRLRILRG